MRAGGGPRPQAAAQASMLSISAPEAPRTTAILRRRKARVRRAFAPSPSASRNVGCRRSLCSGDAEVLGLDTIPTSPIRAFRQ